MGIGEPPLRDARFLHFPQKENIVKGRYHRKKRDYVGKIPKRRTPHPPSLGNPCYQKKSWVYFSF